MRLTRLEIENFKGIRSRQQLELRPITLLFGPNSAGKSTVLHALHYLREILERGNLDPDRTIAGGLIDLGGFASLVHNHELDRPVWLKATLDLTDDQGVDELELNGGGSFAESQFAELQVRYLLGENQEYRDYAIVREVGVEVEVRWSELAETPYVARLAVELDGEPIAAIVSPPQEGRAQLTEFNFAHPLLGEAALPPEDTDDVAASAELSPLEDAIRTLAPEAMADAKTGVVGGLLRVAVGTEFGALPSLGADLALSLRDPKVSKAEWESGTRRVNGLRALLSELILGPMRLTRNQLQRLTYVGPLREVPDRRYRPQATPDEARWAHGLAAWDLLQRDRNGGLTRNVNEWLAGHGRLYAGCRLERVEFKEVSVPGAMHRLFERGLKEDDIGELQDLYSGLPIRVEIVLRDLDSGALVAPTDVGVGISQLVPVIVASLRAKGGMLAIEQPELHVHPAIQVGMGDLFIRAVVGDQSGWGADNKALIIETHSEHIILRLLRRIRETTEDAVPPGAIGIGPDDLSVVYAENGDDGVRLKALRVDPEGDFIDRWPRGFFEERVGELF